jgi:hypothetical protein
MTIDRLAIARDPPRRVVLAQADRSEERGGTFIRPN